MKSVILVFCLTCSFCLIETSLARPVPIKSSNPKAVFVIGGFLETSKNKKFYILDTGNRRYLLKRKTVFLTNQPELKRAKRNAWIDLKVRHSDIIKVQASKMNKKTKAVL